VAGMAVAGMAAAGEAAGGGVEVVGAGADGVGGRVWPTDFPYCHSIIRPHRSITIRPQLIILRRDTTRSRRLTIERRHMGTSPATTVPVDHHLPTVLIQIMACQREWTPTTAARLTSRNTALVDLRLHAASCRSPSAQNWRRSGGGLLGGTDPGQTVQSSIAHISPEMRTLTAIPMAGTKSLSRRSSWSSDGSVEPLDPRLSISRGAMRSVAGVLYCAYNSPSGP
jgi:hypothetical protein